jgi:hypothetical protein
MDIIGQQLIPAERDVVWKALNDPVVLKACLPGCESVEQISPEEFKVVIKAAIGPLRARFQGVLRMTEVHAPASCVMHFDGQGGAVGFGKGSSQVTLSQTPEGTLLAYEAKAQVGGKLAQVGSRLIDSVVKKMAEDFFKAFREQLAPAAPVSVALGVPAAAKSKSSPVDVPVAPTSTAATLTPQTGRSETTLVPGWWLAPAALLGATLAIAGALLIH